MSNDTGKVIAYVALGGAAIYALYKILGKPKPVNPADVQKVSVEYTTPSGVVIPGDVITADITWMNVGSNEISPIFRVDLRRVAVGAGVNEGRPKTSPSARPRETANVKVNSTPVPLDWSAGTRIEVRVILIEMDGVWDREEVEIAPEHGGASDLDILYSGLGG